MNFEELLKYCTDLNESKNEKCLVCHIPLDSDEKYLKLGCSHIFHSDCVKYKSGSIKCLYCEKTSIPQLINCSNPIVTNKILCKMVLKTGPNKGKFCNRPDCKYHKLETKTIQVIDSKTNKPVKPKKDVKTKIKPTDCQVVIKTGPKSGQICGRTDCPYHKKDETKEKIIKPISKTTKQDKNAKLVKPKKNKNNLSNNKINLTFGQILDNHLAMEPNNWDDNIIEIEV